MFSSFNEVENKSTLVLELAPFLTSPPILPPLELTSIPPISSSMSQRPESMYQTTISRRLAISTRSTKNGSPRTNTRNFNPKSHVYHQSIPTLPHRRNVDQPLHKLLRSSNNAFSSPNESLVITTETPLSPTRNSSLPSSSPSSSVSRSSRSEKNTRLSAYKTECSPSSSSSSFPSFG